MTGEPPPALRKRVKLRSECLPYRNAFRRLTSRRQFNEAGPQAIPMSEIIGYLDGTDITDYDEREVYIETICAMDEVYMEYVAKKRQEVLNQSKSSQ